MCKRHSKSGATRSSIAPNQVLAKHLRRITEIGRQVLKKVVYGRTGYWVAKAGCGKYSKSLFILILMAKGG